MAWEHGQVQLTCGTIPGGIFFAFPAWSVHYSSGYHLWGVVGVSVEGSGTSHCALPEWMFPRHVLSHAGERAVLPAVLSSGVKQNISDVLGLSFVVVERAVPCSSRDDTKRGPGFWWLFAVRISIRSCGDDYFGGYLKERKMSHRQPFKL